MNQYEIIFWIWYFVGFIGGLIIAYRADKHISVGDFVVSITLYGVGGLIAISIGIYYLIKIRRLYKKYHIKF